MVVVKDSDIHKLQPFDLPKNAEFIARGDLKSYYRRRLSKLDPQVVRKEEAALDENLQKLTDKEAGISAKLLQVPSSGNADKKKRDELQTERERIKEEITRYVYISGEYQKLIDAIERLKASQ